MLSFKRYREQKLMKLTISPVLDSWSTDPVDWVHGLLLSWTGAPYPEDLKEPQSRSMRLRELGTSFASPWSVAASNVSEASALNVDRGTFWDPRPVFTTNSNQDSDGSRHQSHVCSLWNGNNQHGLVTLAGDAAHPMLPRTYLLLVHEAATR